MKMDILILRGTGLKRGQGRRASAVQPYKDSFPSTTNTMVKEKQKASMRGKANGFTQTRIAQHVIFALFWRNH